MTKKSTENSVKKDDPEQSKRFEETAKLLEADKNAKPFDEAMDSILNPSGSKIGNKQ